MSRTGVGEEPARAGTSDGPAVVAVAAASGPAAMSDARAVAAESDRAAQARVEAVFVLRGEAEQLAERAAALVDRLQEVAIGCEGECDLDVSLDVQDPAGFEAGAQLRR